MDPTPEARELAAAPSEVPWHVWCDAQDKTLRHDTDQVRFTGMSARYQRQRAPYACNFQLTRSKPVARQEEFLGHAEKTGSIQSVTELRELLEKQYGSETLPLGSNIRVFRDGVLPTWEDRANVRFESLLLLRCLASSEVGSFCEGPWRSLDSRIHAQEDWSCRNFGHNGPHLQESVPVVSGSHGCRPFKPSLGPSGEHLADPVPVQGTAASCRGGVQILRSSQVDLLLEAPRASEHPFQQVA